MYRSAAVIFILLFIIATFTFFITAPASPAKEVKDYYLGKANNFIKEVTGLQAAILSGNENKMQQQFLRTRVAYKHIETIVEYYFDFYAIKLNGPPIPFFEEDEPDTPENEVYGMQVIEGLIFPNFKPENKAELKTQIDEMVRLAIELPTINESFEFNDENIFDALAEEVYRITALGITGFDSQTALNALPEIAASLNGIKGFLDFYKTKFDEKLPGKYRELIKIITNAVKYTEQHNQFDAFDRLHFIAAYLNPISKTLGEYKISYNLPDNPSPMYYSTIKKNNTLFRQGAFSPYRFLDDFTTTPKKIEFGKQLFFEKRLSVNNQQSCGGCHQPKKAFTDGLKTSAALDGHSMLKRNAPTIWNAALQRNLFADSRSRSLEDQVLQVLNNSQEMHGSAKKVADKILQIEKYKQMYEEAYPGTQREDTITNICNAIASYERTLIALNSRFDKHMNGKRALNTNEINGFNLFMGKAKCGTCHFMPLFSGAKPPRYYFIESEVIGVPATIDKKSKLDNDSGRYLITGSKIHLFSFKTPTLRNVALTAPYMHNGVFKTLEEVVDFYNDGGGKGIGIAPSNQSLPFDKLNLSVKEKKDIVAFMRSLTDTVGRY